METLLELALLAAAAYGVKSYLFTPEAVQDREIFSSRQTTFVKRLVYEQTARHREIKAPVSSPNHREPVADGLANPESKAAEPINVVITPEAIEPSGADLPEIAPQSENSNPSAPEDSILKRHFLAYRAARQIAIQTPYPSDSVLRRHYDQRQTASLDLTLPETAAEQGGEANNAYSASPTAPKTYPIIPPEDSILKRHFLALIQNEI